MKSPLPAHWLLLLLTVGCVGAPPQFNPVRTTRDQIISSLATALRQTQPRWELTYEPPNGQDSLVSDFDALLAEALALAPEASGYFAGSQWNGSFAMNSPKVTVTVDFHYRFPADQVAARVREADAVAAEAVARVITPDMGDFDKELALHDWLVGRARYDWVHYRAGTVPPADYTPWGVLVARTGVCESYAGAFELLATKAGLKTRRVTGTAGGSPHTWNLIRLEGTWYHLDVTWDDPAGGPDTLSHAYFNLDDRTMATTHAWNRDQTPECPSVAANWYTVKGLWCHDLAALKTLVRSAIQTKQPHLLRRLERFESQGFQKAVGSVLDESAKEARKGLGWTYQTDEALGTVEITFRY